MGGWTAQRRAPAGSRYPTVSYDNYKEKGLTGRSRSYEAHLEMTDVYEKFSTLRLSSHLDGPLARTGEDGAKGFRAVTTNGRPAPPHGSKASRGFRVSA